MLFTVERGEMRVLGVSSVMSAALPRKAEKILTLVLSQKGRAKNPALLIFPSLNSLSCSLIYFSWGGEGPIRLRRRFDGQRGQESAVSRKSPHPAHS
jgi:hypothetical protein